MKRRNFFKSLAVLAIVPTTILAKTPTLSANVEPHCTLPDVSKVKVMDVVIGKPPTFSGKQVKRMTEAIRGLNESHQKLHKAMEGLRKSLTNLYISPEALEDIQNWNIDLIEEKVHA